ncbi:MAG TPA: type VII secretion-associated serine protease mycosin [Actinoplanes sp.]|nr:type VII secretion-associated serine protease mycosin [Actinoplanes sp.]
MTAVAVMAPPAAADAVRDEQWWIDALELHRAHQITKGEGVVVGVIDTGVWAGHPDLQGALVPGADFTSVQKTKDGFVDTDGHGTGVTGMIVGRGHGGDRGLLGIAPEAKVMPLRYQASPGEGGPTAIGGNPDLAMRYAIEHGVDVVNMSFGTRDSWTLREAVKAAAAADVVIVAASGNEPHTVDDLYPAAYPEVVAVGATSRDGTLARFSVTGPQLDLTAPGADIVKLDNDDRDTGYRLSSGTSLAAPLVAGAAALVRAKFPDLSAAEVVHRLQATAVDKGAPGVDPEYGHGVIDIVAALTADVPPMAAPTAAAAAAGPTAGAYVPQPPQQPDRSGILLIGAGCLGITLLAGVGVAVWAVRRRRHAI